METFLSMKLWLLHRCWTLSGDVFDNGGIWGEIRAKTGENLTDGAVHDTIKKNRTGGLLYGAYT